MRTSPFRSTHAMIMLVVCAATGVARIKNANPQIPAIRS
jgi:hypothetical protein